MHKLLFVALGCLCVSVSCWNATVNVVDASRSSLFHPKGRSVKAVICGPDADGEPAAAAAPLYIFGHGFDCQPTDYAWLCATPGVVTALVLAQDLTPFVPDTKDLALDQAYLSSPSVIAKFNSTAGPMNGKFSGHAVLGGHSMGGGTTVLAADPSFANASISALALFAPGLYTRPAAYSHKAGVTAPVMIVSGSMDCGPNQLPKEALPLYQSVSSKVKALIVLKGANHCQWTTSTSGVCAKAECHDLDRADQQASGKLLLGNFLNAIAEPSTGWSAFEGFLSAGASAGKWEYMTMQSAAGTNLTNNCPCK